MALNGSLPQALIWCIAQIAQTLWIPLTQSRLTLMGTVLTVEKVGQDQKKEVQIFVLNPQKPFLAVHHSILFTHLVT